VRLRFGISINASAADGADPVAEARHAEQLGFDLVSVTDHLPGTRPTFETWTLLTWMAAATGRILVGTDVLGLPYRHPAVTAKMAESLHRLSGGRLILGLGGGGSNSEFEAFGLPVRTPREKVEALEEAVEVIQGLWRGPFEFEGRHYAVRGQIAPRPETKLPIWLGVYGPRSLALAGRVADGWIPSMRYAPPERWRRMRDRVVRSAEAAGRDPSAIEYAYNVAVRVDEHAQGREHVVVGGPEQVTKELEALGRDGLTFLNLWPAGDPHEQRERLAAQVLPALREAG
jgi:alkanesulfonate monooxygenase SsuD/methylene tetrahydromethanopterin reductase-like flavin-dependent oxidoreductase (luciferase family)